MEAQGAPGGDVIGVKDVCNVDGAGQQGVHGGGRLVALNGDLDGGQLLGEGVNHRGDDVGGIVEQDAQGQLPRNAGGVVGQVGQGGVVGLGDLLGGAQKPLARLGQLGGVAGALHKGQAQLLLHGADVLAQGGLADKQPVGRRGIIPALRQDYKFLQHGKRHRKTILPTAVMSDPDARAFRGRDLITPILYHFRPDVKRGWELARSA